jgi:hypothetical protein
VFFKKVAWVALAVWMSFGPPQSFAVGINLQTLNPELKKLVPLIQKNRVTLMPSKMAGAKSISFFIHRDGKLERNAMVVANRVTPQKYSVIVEGKTHELKPVLDYVLKEYLLKGTDSGKFQQLYQLTEQIESEYCLNSDDVLIPAKQIRPNEYSARISIGGNEFFKIDDLKNYYSKVQKIARGIVRFYLKNNFQFENRLNQPLNPLHGQILFDGSFVIEFVDNIPTRFLTPLGYLEILGKGATPNSDVTEKLKRSLGLIPYGPEYSSANGSLSQLYVVTHDFNGIKTPQANPIIREAAEYIEYNSALELFGKVKPEARIAAE